jgi:hypothetical protein
MSAPLQVIALSFSREAGSEDRILAEVDRLRGRGVLRLLDMVFVARSQDGTIERLTIGDDEDSARCWRRWFPSRTAIIRRRRRLAVPRPLTGPMRQRRRPFWMGGNRRRTCAVAAAKAAREEQAEEVDDRD